MVTRFTNQAGQATFSDEDLRLFLDAIPTPLSWASIADEKIRFVNRSFKRTFGYADDAFHTISQWIDQVYVRAEDRIKSRVLWERLWTVGQSTIDEVDTVELQILCGDGTVKTVQHRGVLLHDLGIAIATFEDISHHKTAENALRSIAFLDSLTGLPNRRALELRWAQDLPTREAGTAMAALLLIDLDGFKAVNDKLGHEAGDEVLIEVARRLRASVRHDDLACRLGGDEFVVYLPTLADMSRVPRVCQRIKSAVLRPIQIGTERATVGCTVGASLFPQDGRDLKELLNCADQALYRPKAARKGSWGWFRVPAVA